MLQKSVKITRHYSILVISLLKIELHSIIGIAKSRDMLKTWHTVLAFFSHLAFLHIRMAGDNACCDRRYEKHTVLFRYYRR